MSIEPLRRFTLFFILKSSKHEVMVTLKTTPVWTSPTSIKDSAATFGPWMAQQWERRGAGAAPRAGKPVRNPRSTWSRGRRGAGQQRVKKASGRSYFKEVILEEENGKLWGNFTNW